MGPYSRRGRTKGKALGAALRAQLKGLRHLARDLNAQGTPGGDPVARSIPDAASLWIKADQARRDAAAVIEATRNIAHPKVSGEVVRLFNALADEAPLHYVLGWRPKDAGQFIITIGGGAVSVRSSTPRAVWVTLLADFLINPQRDRLRRCPVCKQWYVDQTRNRSALRCSRKCTITWSNAHRSQKSGKSSPSGPRRRSSS